MWCEMLSLKWGGQFLAQLVKGFNKALIWKTDQLSLEGLSEHWYNCLMAAVTSLTVFITSNHLQKVN